MRRKNLKKRRSCAQRLASLRRKAAISLAAMQANVGNDHAKYMAATKMFDRQVRLINQLITKIPLKWQKTAKGLPL